MSREHQMNAPRQTPPSQLPPSLGFATNGLIRHTSERGSAALERHRDDPAALTILLAGDIPILRRSSEGLTSLHYRSAIEGLAIHEQAYLGTFDDRHILATLTDASLAEDWAGRPDLTVLDLRSIATQGLVPEREVGMLAEAKSLLSWHARHRFCANCGAGTKPTCSGFRRDCDACGTQHFPRTDPVVIMLITHEDRCLLGRQSRFPPATIPASQASWSPARPSRRRCGARRSRNPACGSARSPT